MARRSLVGRRLLGLWFELFADLCILFWRFKKLGTLLSLHTNMPTAEEHSCDPGCPLRLMSLDLSEHLSFC